MYNYILDYITNVLVNFEYLVIGTALQFVVRSVRRRNNC
jgi:hypothetical protein